jgi:hypothetical protein
MADCGWEAIDAFKSLDDYKQFLSRLEDDVAVGRAKGVPVDPTKSWGNAWRERWYQCNGEDRIWRLVPPDGPFPGVFELI